MPARDDAPMVEAHDRATWHAWLEANHTTARSAWLVTWRSRTGRPTLAYEDAVEEALCFGWIDSSGGAIDDERSRLYFAPRKRGSVWSASNRARVERLMAAGRITPAGQAAIDRARADGSWSVLEGAERLEVPGDLAAALDAHPGAADAFAAFPASPRKQMLSWVATAKRPETRAARIRRIAEAAAEGRRALG